MRSLQTKMFAVICSSIRHGVLCYDIVSDSDGGKALFLRVILRSVSRSDADEESPAIGLFFGKRICRQPREILHCVQDDRMGRSPYPVS